MALLTLVQAKAQLRIVTSTEDADLTQKVDQASAIIVDYLKSRADPLWTAEDPLPVGGVVVPGPVQAATLVMLTHFWEHRGDDMGPDEAVWLAVQRLLVRYRDPTLA